MLPLPLKLVRSLVLGETITISNPFLPSPKHKEFDDDIDETHLTHNFSSPHKITRFIRGGKNAGPKPTNRTPLLLFTPTKELVSDTYRLATLVRDIGMNLYPNPSLSHMILSWPSSLSSSQPSLSCSSFSSSSSSSSSLHCSSVPLPFPSLSVASISHLRCFVSLSKGFFKLVFLINSNPLDNTGLQTSNWDCCSVSLISRITGIRIDSMDTLSRALAGKGWTVYKTKSNFKSIPPPDSGDTQTGVVYLFRKLDSTRVRGAAAAEPNGNSGISSGECRSRELRLPQLDFRNAPLRILQYILLMTDDIFYLA